MSNKTKNEEMNMDREYNSQLPYYDKIKEAKSFFYDITFDVGGDFHVVIFWKIKENTCYYLESYAIGTTKKNPIPSIVQYREISLNIFDDFIKKIVSQGIMNIQLHRNDHILSNLHNYCYILLEDKSFHCFQAGCGFDSSPILREINNTIKNICSKAIHKGRKLKKYK